MLNGESISIYGDGEQKRAFSDIQYCLEPLEKLMTMGDREIFNLGSDKEYTLNEAAEIFQKVAKKFDFNPDIEHLQERHEVKHAYSNHDKAKKILDFKDETNLEQTITEMFEWAIKQPNREVKQINYELTKGMYGYWK